MTMTYTERLLIDIERKVDTGMWGRKEYDLTLEYIETEQAKEWIAQYRSWRIPARKASTSLMIKAMAPEWQRIKDIKAKFGVSNRQAA